MPRCRYCKEKFEASNSLDRFCSIKHAIAWTATPEGVEARGKAKAKLQKTKKQEHRRKKREFNRKDLKWQHRLTQAAFNKMRRLEELLWFKQKGLEPECISCGKTSMDWCCGHFKTVGSSGALRYEWRNTYLQCNRYCNQALSGNIEGNKNTRGLKKGLIDRFGYQQGNAIISWCEKHQHDVKKWTWQELERMRKEFNQRIKALEAELSESA